MSFLRRISNYVQRKSDLGDIMERESYMKRKAELGKEEGAFRAELETERRRQEAEIRQEAKLNRLRASLKPSKQGLNRNIGFVDFLGQMGRSRFAYEQGLRTGKMPRQTPFSPFYQKPKAKQKKVKGKKGKTKTIVIKV